MDSLLASQFSAIPIASALPRSLNRDYWRRLLSAALPTRIFPAAMHPGASPRSVRHPHRRRQHEH
jgi:hypothetical protein